jgi:transposase
MADLFWLSDEQWVVIEPFMPKNQPGPERNDDRQVISGIIHVVKTGCRWCDCPSEYGPPTTIYNRFNRWSRRGFWKAMLVALAKAGWTGEANAIDATYVKAHRSAQGGKGGPRRKTSVPRAAARRLRSTRSSMLWAARRSSF